MAGRPRQWDIRSAHFLRFVDLRGHHIRLRLKAVEGVLDDAYASMRELGAVAQQAEARTVQRLVSDPMTGGIGASRPGITFGVYGPEYDKYGGVAGVEEAERHFYVSSRWCLDHQVWQIPRPVPRAALAARFLALAARSAPLPEAELLSAHLRMWGSRLPAHLRDGSALGPIVQQLLEVIEFQFDEIPVLEPGGRCHRRAGRRRRARHRSHGGGHRWAPGPGSAAHRRQPARPQPGRGVRRRGCAPASS